MKKNKLAKLFKIGILFFGISILLFNCEQENSEFTVENKQTISIEKVKKQFKASFNKNAFSNLSKPKWENVKVFYNDEGNQYLEIPFQTINQNDIEKGTSVSFDKLIAISKKNKIELKIVHFFGINIINNPVDFKNMSHTELYNFTGFVTLYDLNKNVLDIKQYNKGEDTYKKINIGSKSKDENSISARVDESTWEYTETICTRGCWYWEYSDGSRETISCSPWECTTTTYSGSGGNGSSNSGNNTSYNTEQDVVKDETTVSPAFEQDYKNRMSNSELAIFESMPRHKQLAYLLNAQKAIWEAEELFPSSLYNGIGDAFRHAYFNASNSILLGVKMAEQLSTAHENQPSHYIFNYKENQMDLFNNAVGRTRYNWFSDGYGSLQESILDAISKGELRYLSHLDGSGRATSLSTLKPTN